MKKQELIDLGIAEDVAEKILVIHGKDIEGHKTKITELQGQFDAASAQLTEANAAIEGFKKLKPEELQAAADDWRTKYEQAQEDAKKQVQSLKFDHALDSALASAKAKNTKAVKALLSSDALKLQDDGSILGLKEQLEKIKSDSDYLFESDKPAPKIVTGGNNKSVLTDAVASAARKAAGLPVEE